MSRGASRYRVTGASRFAHATVPKITRMECRVQMAIPGISVTVSGIDYGHWQVAFNAMSGDLLLAIRSLIGDEDMWERWECGHGPSPGRINRRSYMKLQPCRETQVLTAGQTLCKDGALLSPLWCLQRRAGSLQGWLSACPRIEATLWHATVRVVMASA